ncbi:hypothetical protein [Caldivirga maquilingensis]|uniref:Uncharacterized protein n=1 Tax=Caldivirga maquilingensis (strain ATCC 700844 / DSM 13496 / JCM 10307 / IC-167) TaxID=397948 RepID=A8MAX8_CALMQ|nr:hypothetical protein [Caldivirga maquilingensis]ABW02607.1 hypothetical protein Cmaq_1784 [Caldivirga maquilingensis IC-167]
MAISGAVKVIYSTGNLRLNAEDLNRLHGELTRMESVDYKTLRRDRGSVIAALIRVRYLEGRKQRGN